MGPAFYTNFYQEFFERYHDYEQLLSSWRREKRLCAEFVLDRIKVDSKILSVGCGLAYMEHCMLAQVPQLDLFIHEVQPIMFKVDI